jgi:hypothetical protein
VNELQAVGLVARQEVSLDPLAQMHLLLREHGWEPECHNSSSGKAAFWSWSHPERPGHFFETSSRGTATESDPNVLEPNDVGIAYNATYDLDGLRHRLKQLAAQANA